MKKPKSQLAKTRLTKAKCQRFIDGLNKLCEEHGVYIHEEIFDDLNITTKKHQYNLLEFRCGGLGIEVLSNDGTTQCQ